MSRMAAKIGKHSLPFRFAILYVFPSNTQFCEARPAGFEPATRGLEERGGVFAGVSRGYKSSYLSLLALAAAHWG